MLPENRICMFYPLLAPISRCSITVKPTNTMAFNRSRSSLAFILFFAILTGCQATGEETPPLPDPVFETYVLDDSISIGYGLAIGHVDDDGRPDILMADKKQFVWYRNGDWQRFVIAENLTPRDNVCLAARDIDGDGLVELAVGAMWNPGETSDEESSGSVHYLIRPDDPTDVWEPVQLPHEPTVHRMRWVQTGDDQFDLVVLPLHGRGNTGGEGAGVRIFAYSMPEDPSDSWTLSLIDESMHMTHNFEIEDAPNPALYIAGREGIRRAAFENGAWTATQGIDAVFSAAGEVRRGYLGDTPFFTAIEPMHGTDLVVYVNEGGYRKTVIDTSFVQGHALATGDLLDLGRDQIVAGWRNPNADQKVGVKIYTPVDASGTSWQEYLLDDNTMAVEDLRIADLDQDGKLDVIAAGRATNNLKIYWNRTQ